MFSGIQHYYFCKRQWALIHIEQQWKENEHTTTGKILHEKADNPLLKEKRKKYFVSRAIPIVSKKLGITGILDVVEFFSTEEGIEIPGKKGKWKPNIIEYKKGREKKDNRDVVQLTAQVICLEEMLNIKIKTADLYYFATKQRKQIEITQELRDLVNRLVEEMHLLMRKKKTPKAEYFKNCKLCSLNSICMPRLSKKKKSIKNYLYGDEI